MSIVRWSNRARWHVLLACLVAMVGGCGAGNGRTAGPCVITYDEPLFSITSARDAQSDAPLGQVIIREFVYDRPPGTRPPIIFLTNHVGLTPSNVTISGETLTCTVRCAFGAGEGGYTFTFDATGYRDTVVAVPDAKFSRGSGSCPRTVSGGVALDLRLTRR